MNTISDICCACGAHGPVAMLATTGGDRQFALCRACSNRPEAVRAFAARFDGERDRAARIREANRFLAEQAAASGAAR